MLLNFIGCINHDDKNTIHSFKLIDIRFSSPTVAAGTPITVTTIVQSIVSDTVYYEYEFFIKRPTDSIFYNLNRRIQISIDTIQTIVPDCIDSYWKIVCRATTRNQTDSIIKIVRIAQYTIDHHPAYLGTDASCNRCHSIFVQSWQQTAHATTGNRRIFNSNWLTHCNSCHTTGYELNYSNGGYDERPIERFDHVQCESCHGPSEFYGVSFITHQVHQGFIDSKLAIQSCGNCHSQSHLSIYTEWLGSGHARSASVSHILHTLPIVERNQCVGCHIYTESIKKLKYNLNLEYPTDSTRFDGIGCATCHTPHNHSLHQWKDLRHSPDVLCNQCHQSNIDGTPTAYQIPYHPQNDLLSNNIQAIFGHEFFNLPSNTEHSEWSNQCSVCHLYSTPWSYGSIAFTNHQFRPNYLTCKSCHPQATTEFIVERQQPFQDSLSILNHQLEFLKNEGDTLSFEFRQGRWMYWFFSKDGSLGIHNPTWTRHILRSVIMRLDSLIQN
ncbi:MAG: hypothetical protein N2450_03000 [bacterium]|nr:hypothetical protein [bacterium]